MLEHRDFAVCIKCGEEALEEFATKIEDEKTASCHVASETGKMFHIVMKNNFNCTAAVHFYVDGQCTEGKFADPGREVVSLGLRVTPNEYRPYTFVPLAVTDDDTAANPRDPKLRDLGTIEVRVYRADRGKRIVSASNKKNPTEEAVHEKSKKAGTHRVGFADVVNSPTTMYETIYHDPSDSPYAVFKIRYRPQDLLKAQGIILSEAQTEDHVDSPTVDSDSAEDLESEIVVVDQPIAGPSSRKRRREEALRNIIDIDALGPDDEDDDNIAAIEAQLQTLAQQLQCIKRRKTEKKPTSLSVKKEKIEEAEVQLN